MDTNETQNNKQITNSTLFTFTKVEVIKYGIKKAMESSLNLLTEHMEDDLSRLVAEHLEDEKNHYRFAVTVTKEELSDEELARLHEKTESEIDDFLDAAIEESKSVNE